MMWKVAANAMTKPSSSYSNCSNDDRSLCRSGREVLECPICCELFNIVKNAPYVLWCGHTLCRNCVIALPWAFVNFPTHPVQLPLFISCPWCQFLSIRLVYKGNIKFPHKNFFLLWIIENHSFKMGSYIHQEHQPASTMPNYVNAERIPLSICKFLAFFVNLIVKFPLGIIFLLIILCTIPASAAILALYILITVLFSLPWFLILYFSYRSLDWLIREINT